MTKWKHQAIWNFRHGAGSRSIEYRHRGPKKTREVQVRDQLVLHTYDPDEVEKAIKFAASHEESQFNDMSSGGDPIFVIEGWRPATDDEIVKLDETNAETDRAARRVREKQLEEARELLRKAGELD